MDQHEFIQFADLLGERQAEAFYRRRVDGQGRQEAAAEMDTSASNVDNLERAAHQKIIRASNLLNVVEGTGIEVEAEIGVCAICDEPTESLTVHPDDGDRGIENARMICADCGETIDG